MRFFNLV